MSTATHAFPLADPAPYWRGLPFDLPTSNVTELPTLLLAWLSARPAGLWDAATLHKRTTHETFAMVADIELALEALARERLVSRVQMPSGAYYEITHSGREHWEGGRRE